MARSNDRRVVKITADVKANRDLKKLASSMGLMNKEVKSISGNFRLLRNVTIGWFGAMRLTDLVKMSDTMQLLGDRIEVLTNGQADAFETLSQLRDVADATQQSLDLTANSFTRMAAAIGGTGIETKFLIGLTKVLQDSFLVAGSEVKETTSTTIQLAQAFASGEVRGQELRSVMEQNATVARLLRKEYGKDIYKKAALGAITASDVLRILFDNQERLAQQAKKLKPTIERTIIAAFNGLRLAIFKLNDEYKLSAAFASILTVVIEKLSLAVTVAALTAIPFLIRAISISLIPALFKLGEVLTGLTLTNVFTILAVGIAIAVVLIFKNLDELTAKFRRFQAFLSDVGGAILEFRKSIISPFDKNKDVKFAALDKAIDEQIKQSNRLRKEARELEKNAKKTKFFGLSPEEIKKGMDVLKGVYKGGAQTISKAISSLNVGFREGSITVIEYFDQLNKFKIEDLNKQFGKGSVQLDAYNKQLNALQLNQLNRDFNEGDISLKAYRQSLDELKLEDLRNQLDAGTISLMQFNNEALKFSDAFSTRSVLVQGANNYIDSIGTASEETVAAISRSFNALENELVNAFTKGQFSFKAFANSLLADLARIVTRMLILKPLVEGLTSSFGFSGFSGTQLPATGGGGGTLTAANGAAFDTGGIRKFANGGIVGSPTMFGHSGGTGLMGEAGPEAILPLSRNKGKLGVEASVTPVNINIINNSDTEITSSETAGPSGERNIEVVIETKVREGLAKGTYDKQLRSNFGINRKGY